MAWSRSAAVDVLRACLGDGHTDHYEFKAEVTPTPDGLHTLFYCGRTRVVEESFQVFLAGVEYDGFDLFPESGTVEIAPSGYAPSGVVLCSYFYRWFNDNELVAFLEDAAQQLGFTGVADASLPVDLKTIIIDFATAHAFTRKAAEFADSITASTPDGYSIDQAKQTPNWTKLADDALKRGQAKLKFYMESNQLGKPSFAMTSFKLPIYQPRGM